MYFRGVGALKKDPDGNPGLNTPMLAELPQIQTMLTRLVCKGVCHKPKAHNKCPCYDGEYVPLMMDPNLRAGFTRFINYLLDTIFVFEAAICGAS